MHLIYWDLSIVQDATCINLKGNLWKRHCPHFTHKETESQSSWGHLRNITEPGFEPRTVQLSSLWSCHDAALSDLVSVKHQSCVYGLSWYCLGKGGWQFRRNMGMKQGMRFELEAPSAQRFWEYDLGYVRWLFSQQHGAAFSAVD